MRVAQKCEGVRETTPVSSFGGPEMPETAGESSGAQAQSGGGTPLVSALGELPPGRGGVGSLGRDRVVGKAEEPGASSRSVCTGSGASNSSVYGDADLDVDMDRHMRTWTDDEQRCTTE